MKYTKTPTSAEVWSVIRARHHKELVVVGSFSAPDGDHHGNPDEAVMMTEYGFRESDYPLIGARTTWRVGDREKTEQTEYWMCLPREGVKP